MVILCSEYIQNNDQTELYPNENHKKTDISMVDALLQIHENKLKKDDACCTSHLCLKNCFSNRLFLLVYLATVTVNGSFRKKML